MGKACWREDGGEGRWLRCAKGETVSALCIIMAVAFLLFWSGFGLWVDGGDDGMMGCVHERMSGNE